MTTTSGGGPHHRPTERAVAPRAHHPADLHGLFLAGVNAHDIGALMGLYEPDALGVDLAGEPLDNRDELREFLIGFLHVAQHLDGETRRVHVAKDLALMSSTWHATLTTTTGQTTHMHGTSAEVARRQHDGTWLFAIDTPVFIPHPDRDSAGHPSTTD